MSDWNFFKDMRLRRSKDPLRTVSQLLGRRQSIGSTQPSDYHSMVNQYKSWVYKCVSLNASSVARTPLRLYVARQKIGKIYGCETTKVDIKTERYLWENRALHPVMRKAMNIEEVVEHPFLDLMKEVNPHMNDFDLKENWVLFLDLTGNCYMWVVAGDNGLPVELWVIPSQWVNILLDPKEYIVGYKYRMGKQEVIFSPDEIVHFKYPNPMNTVYGMGCVAGAANAIDVNGYMRDYEASVFVNNARPDMFLTTTASLSEEDIQELKERWGDSYSGRHRAGKVAVLSGGLDVKQISYSPRDLNFLMGRKATLTEIAALFGVPLSKFITEDVNKANAEAGEYQYAKDTILPRLIRIEQKLNEKLLPRYDDKLFCAFDNPVPEDQEIRRKERESNLRMGYSSINQERERDRLPPVSWGKLPWMQLNLVQVGEGGATPPQQEMVDRNKKVLVESISKGVSEIINKRKQAKKPEVVKQSEPQREPWQVEYEEKFQKRGDKYTVAFRDKLKKLFREQEKEVLTNLKKSAGFQDFKSKTKRLCLKGEIDQYLFGKKKWEKKFAKEGKTYIEAGLVDSGEQMMQLLISASFNVEDPRVISYLKTRVLRFSKKVNKTTLKALKRQLLEGLEAGEGIRELRKRVQNVFGFADKYRAENIARTEVMRASNAGAEMGMMQSGVVEGKEWMTLFDGRECFHCTEMDGKTMKLGGRFFNRGDKWEVQGRILHFDYDYIQHPPLHNRCRCSLIPVMK